MDILRQHFLSRLGAVALAAAVIPLVAPPAFADILIGVAAPLSGPFAAFGAEMRDGAQAAVDDLNAAGGINGERLSLVAMDDACTAKKADSVANQLAGKGAALVVGHLCLKASMAGAAVYAAEKIIEISPGTTFAKFTDERAGPGIFRLCGRDDSQGTFAGQFLVDRYRDSNVAIIDDKTTYGKGLADAAAAVLAAAGKELVLRDSYDAGEKDFAVLVSQLDSAAADAVYIGGGSAEAALIARRMKDHGMTTTVIGGDALLADDFGTGAGDAAEGTLVTFPADPRTAPAAASVVATLNAKGTDAAGYSLPSYAAVQIWAAAATSAGSSDFDKVVAAMQGRTFATVIGDVAFDEKGDLRDPRYDWYVWQGGTYVEKTM